MTKEAKQVRARMGRLLLAQIAGRPHEQPFFNCYSDCKFCIKYNDPQADFSRQCDKCPVYKDLGGIKCIRRFKVLARRVEEESQESSIPMLMAIIIWMEML